MKNIKVIGSGVSGLTTAIVLLEKGYPVEIITAQLPHATTSSKAAAIWFPYEVKPRDKANTWSLASYETFVRLSTKAETGVSMISMTGLIEKEEDAWWKAALPASEIQKAAPEKLPAGFSLAYVMRVPLIETQLYLDYLMQQFKTLGGQLSIQKIEQLAKLRTSNTIIVNCAGLGARELVQDTALYPIQGQIVKAERQEGIPCITAEFAFGEAQDELAYVVPRTDCIVLGGTCVKGAEDTTPSDKVSAGIIERCKMIAPALEQVQIQAVEVGLRPGRSAIRLEQEAPDLIHNYGHGGGGFTVSWGCAYAVLELLEAIQEK